MNSDRVLQMLQDGHNIQEIANSEGVSRQRVHGWLKARDWLRLRPGPPKYSTADVIAARLEVAKRVSADGGSLFDLAKEFGMSIDQATRWRRYHAPDLSLARSISPETLEKVSSIKRMMINGAGATDISKTLNLPIGSIYKFRNTHLADLPFGDGRRESVAS